MQQKLDLAMTASLVNESRARREEISLDRCAKFWVTVESREDWEAFAREVYPHDALQLSLRNRFFLDRSYRLLAAHDDSGFVNLGAGFSSYPFLFDRPVPSLEVDQRYVVEYKAKRIADFQRSGQLPSDRTIELFSVDFNDTSSMALLEAHLDQWCGRPTAIILEGVSYYLPAESLHRLFAMLASVQQAGSGLMLDYWTAEMLEHPVTQRFREFADRRGWHPYERYTPLETESLANLERYTLVEATDIQSLEREFTGSATLTADAMLPECYAILERIA